MVVVMALAAFLPPITNTPSFTFASPSIFQPKVDSPSKSKTQPSAISLAVSVFGLTCLASSAAAVKATMKRRMSVEKSSFIGESFAQIRIEDDCQVPSTDQRLPRQYKAFLPRR